MQSRPDFATDDMIRSCNHLTTSQLGEFCSYMIRTYADRHGLIQSEIDAHKGAQKRLHPEWRMAEKLRLETLINRQQVEIDELRAALNGYL